MFYQNFAIETKYSDVKDTLQLNNNLYVTALRNQNQYNGQILLIFTDKLACNIRCGDLGCDSVTNCLDCVGTQNQSSSRIPNETCKCPVGYWDDPNQIECQSCGYRCGYQGCDSATNCLNCVGIQNQSSSRIPNEQCKCPNGYWDDPNQVDCQTCDTRCGDLGCDSVTNCLDCVGTQNQSSSRITNEQCKCPNGYWDDPDQVDCQPCDTRCGDLGCNSATNCLDCVGTQNQISSRITNEQCKCPNGFWDDPIQIECQPCDLRCGDLGCDSANNCLNCVGIQNQGSSRIPNEQCKCPNGYWDDPNQVDCQTCDSRCGDQGCITTTNCLNCVGTQNQIYSRILSEQCKCPVGYWDDLNQQDCQPCDIRCGNQGCIAATNCLNCVGTQNQIYSRLLNEQCKCPNGYWDDPNQIECLSCNLRCGDLGCDSATNCLNCVGIQSQIYSRISNETCKCPVGYWDDPNQQDCQPCVTNCEVCQDEKTCTVCKFPMTFNNQNQCQCPDKYYLQNNECLKCPKFCETCLSEKQCLTCVEPKDKRKPENECKGPDGYYSDPQNIQIFLQEQQYKWCEQNQFRDKQSNKCMDCYYLKKACYRECPQPDNLDLFKIQKEVILKQEGGKNICIEQTTFKYKLLMITLVSIFVLMVVISGSLCIYFYACYRNNDSTSLVPSFLQRRKKNKNKRNQNNNNNQNQNQVIGHVRNLDNENNNTNNNDTTLQPFSFQYNFAVGHTKAKAPDPIRTPKLSVLRRGQYQGGGPLGKSTCRQPFFLLKKFALQFN
ncbi:Insulin-like growth factor binding protein, N-terminal [Pseudocohnilembus persalinus]|uniref:Insulin-like growth factor binding protein, N-terminal n=1 Tax=Pseudocohnilembus persalinus TaxID=266149 RepID=A0A0V0R624_PSEPJ|nr:Insulin-like growth factor binding protein, N-terminal [Pseudocohnilembus persalinus]|eukprot:KRX09802.1 Insulin-like growth factor binding protein, N-terminal [Pseudocohnilembus persalinus]